jgi:hypothetical protein
MSETPTPPTLEQRAEQIVRSQEEYCHGLIPFNPEPYCSCAPEGHPLCEACAKFAALILSALQDVRAEAMKDTNAGLLGTAVPGEVSNKSTPSGRAETGPMRFAGDWCGVFIRGDNAGAYGMTIKAALNGDGPLSAFEKMQLGGLARLLLGSDHHTVTEPQEMRPFDEATSPATTRTHTTKATTENPS